ncbi:MAG TPA: tetratricopeptide repeat protein [Chitinophagaceae bacterium]|nr:tetratricopeptide repeat protein [Chitinophagaceae bacterium]
MKQLIIITLFLLQSLLIFAQQEKSYVKKGNDLYQQQKYKDAEDNYRKSVEKKTQNIEGNFNLGDALYKQKKFTDASEHFNKLAGSANNKTLTAAAYHNLGNSFLENKKLEESIDAYKKALLNNPKDDETRYNLAYAQEKLKKQQQQQNKQNKDNKNQNNKNQDKKNQDDKNKDNKSQDNKNQDNKNQDKKDQQQQQPDKISKEDAERMLEALNNDEKQTQDKLKNKKLKGEKAHITKDW